MLHIKANSFFHKKRQCRNVLPKQIVSGDETIRDSGTLKLEGKATLDFANGQEKLNANFNNWYDVDVTKNLNTNTGSVSFSGGNKSGFGDGFIPKEGNKIDKNVLHFKGETDNAYANNNFIGEHWDSEYNGHARAMNMGTTARTERQAKQPVMSCITKK